MWIAGLLGGAVVLLICVSLLAAIPLVKRHAPGPTTSPSEYNLPYEDVHFSTLDGIILRGWWISGANTQYTIIMLHGYAGSMDPDLKYVPALVNAGFNVLMFNFRAHGTSDGCLTSLGALEVCDVHSAVKFASEKGSTWIGLLGFSMGGRAALLSAPQIPQVKAVVSDGAPARLLTVIRLRLNQVKVTHPVDSLIASMMLLGASLLTRKFLFKYEPYYLARKLNVVPVLFINGEQDPYITKPEVDKMIRDAGPLAQSWSIPTARHREVDELFPGEYIQRVIGFFHKNLPETF